MALLAAVVLSVSLLTVPAAHAAGKPQMVTLDFVDVELATVTKFISDVTGKNFIFDEKVRGTITIIAPTEISSSDAFKLFTSVLELKGYTVVPAGKSTYKIIPTSDAKGYGIDITSTERPVDESYVARLIPLNHISSNDAVDFLKPVVSKNGHISAFSPGNLLLVVDSGINVNKVLSIIDAIDIPPTGDEPELVILKHAGAESVADLLNEGIGRSNVRKQTETLTDSPKAVADERLNAVVLFGDKTARGAMKRIIALLDVPSGESQGGINVYFLENADAEEMGKVLDGIIQRASDTSKNPAAQAQARLFKSAKDIAVVPDKTTNSLVISASQSDYQSLASVIKQLDRRSRQVYVEAMIVEASVDKLRELGTQWRAIGTKNGEPIAIGGVGTIDTSSLQSLITGLSGLTMGGMGNFMTIPIIQPDGTSVDVDVPGFAAIFNLSIFKDTVNVLSTPQILTADNREAEIVVGENVPFITKRESDPTRTQSVFSTIERKDVGITLKITPQITEGDYVKLDIYQEISSVKQDSENIITSVGPTTTKRSTSTSVIAKDTQTIVISGLMQEQAEDTVTKVPLLGDIPLLGYLFKTTSVSKKKTNLIVFLTPHIIKESSDLENITIERRERFKTGEAKHMEGLLIVGFEPDVSDDVARLTVEQHGATVVKRLGKDGPYLVRIADGKEAAAAATEFSNVAGVRYAEPNYLLKTNE